MSRINLTDDEARLVGKLLVATVDEFYPTRWFDWDEVAALRDRLLLRGIGIPEPGTSFETEYPRPAPVRNFDDMVDRQHREDRGP